MSRGKPEQQFKDLLSILGYTANQIEILEIVATQKSTVKEIQARKGIQNASHIHSYFQRFRQENIIEETRTRPRRYGLSVKGLTELLNRKREKLKSELEELENVNVESLVHSLSLGKVAIEAAVTPPTLLINTKEFHDAAAHILDVSKNVIIGTVCPFPWVGKYQIEQKTPQEIENYWKAHKGFLQRSKEKSGFHLTYVIDVEKYVKLLDSKNPSERSGNIRAIFDCLGKIEEGYPLDFLNRPKNGESIALTTFIVGVDSGLFAISVANSVDFVMNGLLLNHPAMAEMYGSYIEMVHQRAEAYGESSKTRLKKILETILSETTLQSQEKRRLTEKLLRA